MAHEKKGFGTCLCFDASHFGHVAQICAVVNLLLSKSSRYLGFAIVPSRPIIPQLCE